MQSFCRFWQKSETKKVGLKEKEGLEIWNRAMKSAFLP